jgi:hypothetical protein
MKNTSLNELVYELLELRRAYIKDTDPLDRRLVIDWIQSQRARLLKQKFDQPFASIDDHYVQSLSPIAGTGIPMEKTLSNELGIKNYDFMWRTAIDIPRTIESKDGVGSFVRIGPADRLSDHFQITTHKKALALGYGKFNYNAIYAFVLGDRVYLTSNGGLHFAVKYLDIQGVFQDPIAAARIKDPTWDYNDDYPINKEIVDQLKVLIVNEKFQLTLFQAHDKTDDQDDNPEGNAGVSKRQTQSSS